jgi:hypothetical protein
MSKSTTLIVATIGLGGLGYFLYKKGLFSNKSATSVVTDAKVAPSPAPITTIKTPITCPSGSKLQLVDINCSGADCQVHCVAIPAPPERKIMPIDPIVNMYPIDPIEVVIDPYIGKPSLQNRVPVNTYTNDPFINNNNNWSVNKNLNQLLYL